MRRATTASSLHGPSPPGLLARGPAALGARLPRPADTGRLARGSTSIVTPRSATKKSQRERATAGGRDAQTLARGHAHIWLVRGCVASHVHTPALGD